MVLPAWLPTPRFAGESIMSKAVKSVTRAVTGVFDAVLKPVQKVIGKLFGVPDLPSGGAGNSASELKQIIRSSKEPARYVFGHIGVGGLQLWAQEQDGDQTEGEELYQVFAISEGAIHSLDNVYLDQAPISETGSRASYALLKTPTAADTYLLTNSPGWQSSMIGRGLSAVRLTLRYDPDYFSSGLPTPLFEVHGRNDVYDPRTETSSYSDNVALVTLWYIRNRLGVPDDEILWESFIEAANICDEIVTNPDGSTERRYTMAGGFKADERKDRVLADLEMACSGTLLRIGGKFGLLVGAYYGPYDFTIDENMVIGPVSGQTEVSRADAVNTMRGKFVDPSQRWAETDYPAVVVDQWVAEDGGPIEDSLDLRFVTSAFQAQRLANIALRRKRAGGTLRIPLNFRGYACRPGRVIRVNLPTINVDGEFRVVNWEFSGTEGCIVTLEQEDAAIYDDAVGQPFNPFGFIQLPTGGIGSPTGLQYVLQNVGEVIQGRLVWNPVDAALHYNVVIKREGVAVQAAQVPAGVERCDVGGLEAGNYTAEVRARGRLGQSGPAVVSFAINVPPMPESVGISAANDSITLTPRLSGSHGRVEFEFRWHPTPLPLNQVAASAEYLSIGASYTHTGLTWGTDYHYYVRSVNAYGASPWLYVPASTTADVEQILQGLTGQIRESELNQALQERIDKIDGPDTLDGSVAQRIAAEAEQRSEDVETVRSELIDGFEAEALARAQAIQQETDNRTVAITQLSEQVETEFGLLGLEINAIAAAYDATAASIYTMTQIRINEAEVVATQINQLSGRVEDNESLILDERQIRTNQYSSLATQVGILSARLDARPSLNSGFEPGADFNAWSATSGNAISAVTSGVYSGLQSALVTSTTASANPNSGGVRRIIAPETAAEFAGHEIRLAVYAKQPATGAAAEFALAYQIAGESVQWQRFTPGAEWAFYDVVIDVPEGTGGAQHAVAIWGSTAGGGNGVQVDRLLVTFAETDIPEVTAAIEQIQQALVDQQQAVAQELSGFETQLNSNSAAIQEEITTRSTLTDSLATSVQTLQAQTQDNTAAIIAERDAWSSETNALAQQIEQLVADLGDGGAASLEEERQVRASEDEYLASIQRVLAAAEGVNSAAYQFQTTTRITAEEAEARRNEQLQAQIGDNKAAIQNEANVRATALSAQASQISALQSAASGNTAAIQQEASTRADQYGVLAQQINTVQVQFNEELASVQQNTQAQYNENTQRLEAMWTLRIDNGGRVSGFGLADDGQESLLGFRADRIYFAHPNSGDEVFPMVLDGGSVVMNDALIKQLLFTKLRSSDGTLVFKNGKLQASYIAADQLTVNWAQIQNVTVQRAQIADAAISAAKIGIAEVDTLRIQGNAVTIPLAVQNAGAVQIAHGSTGFSGWQPVANVNTGRVMDGGGSVQGVVFVAWETFMDTDRPGSVSEMEVELFSSVTGITLFRGVYTHTYGSARRESFTLDSRLIGLPVSGTDLRLRARAKSNVGAGIHDYRVINARITLIITKR
ncbi:hypothetical protein CTT34_10380 [Vreelandella aquamarina]|uniref:Fibronectin type-III domain-containing protein n=1 Tax=Vreelandella aquamarina TaxID=77097 RepID=A0A857GNI1_9GAMM|nr:hypothetical protein CTT34_10380 [Halomonas meridiana]